MLLFDHITKVTHTRKTIRIYYDNFGPRNEDIYNLTKLGVAFRHTQQPALRYFTIINFSEPVYFLLLYLGCYIRDLDW